jgi:hypothetical protein
MKNIKRLFNMDAFYLSMARMACIIIALIILFPCMCHAEGLVSKILLEMEKRNKLGSDLIAKVTLTEQRTRQGVRQHEYIYYRRDADDSYLMVTVSPDREKGNGFLRVEDNLWMYRQNTRTFQHLSRGDKIDDTDVSAEDFEKRKFTELYGPVTDKDGNEIYSEEMLGEIPVYKFEVKAKVKDVSYPKHIYWVRRDNYLLLKQDSYSLSDTLMVTDYFIKYTQIENRCIPLKFMVVDQFEQGNKTIGEISGISLKPIDDDIFTKAYLENLSK